METPKVTAREFVYNWAHEYIESNWDALRELNEGIDAYILSDMEGLDITEDSAMIALDWAIMEVLVGEGRVVELLFHDYKEQYVIFSVKGVEIKHSWDDYLKKPHVYEYVN
jgi:hypothetical protein